MARSAKTATRPQLPVVSVSAIAAQHGGAWLYEQETDVVSLTLTCLDVRNLLRTLDEVHNLRGTRPGERPFNTVFEGHLMEAIRKYQTVTR